MGVRETVGLSERRLARLGRSDMFPTAYSDPIPSPDGEWLGWISDRDGRPQLFIAPLPPDGAPITEPEFALMSAEAGDVQAISWSPDGAWIACQLALFGGERTRVRLVSPDGGETRDIAPGAAAVTLGVWSPGGRQLGVTVFPEGAGDGQACLVDVRDGTSTVLAAGPAARVCAVSGDGRWSGSADAAPGTWSWWTCGAAGAPSCCRAPTPTWPTPGSGSPAGSSTCTPTPAATGPPCSPSRCAAAAR